MAGVWKRDGTVAVTNGSKKVTGTGTTFADAKNGVAKGHLFCMTTGTTVDLYEVDYVVSNTELHLVQAFRGTTGTGKAYEIITTFSDSIPEFARKLNASLSYYQSQSDMVQQLFTSDAAEITVTAPDGTTHNLIPWKRVTSEGEGQAARAKVEADRAKTEADRSGTEADRAAGIVAAAALPLPDVWAPLSDSLRLITGYGRDVLVGSDVVARMVNFSRSTTATYIDKSGVLRTAAINEPRFEKEGLLIEGQSTNLITTSAALATSTVTVSAGSYTLSFYGTGSVTLSGAATGVLTGTDADKRVSLTVTTVAGELTLTVTGACNNAQLEALPFATSYIPTIGAAATRAADVVSINADQNIGNKLGEFTLSSDLHLLGISPNRWIECGNATLGGVGSTGVNLRWRMLAATSTGSLVPYVKKLAVVSIGQSTWLARLGDDIATGAVKLEGSDTTDSIIRIGNRVSSTDRPLNGHIRNFRIWHRALTYEQIKALK